MIEVTYPCYPSKESGQSWMSTVAHECNRGGPHLPVYKQVLSWVLVIPLLYFAVYGQFSFLNHSNSAFMTENGDLLQTSQGMRPQVVLYYGVMLSFILAGRRRIWRVALQNKVLLLAPALAALSSLWSEAPSLTLRNSLELTMTTLFAFYLSERFTTEHLMKLLMLAGIVAAILSLLLVFFAPEYGIYHRDGSGAWQGIFSHKNALGVGMAFFLTPMFFCRVRLVTKLKYGALLLLLIAMSQSREAWLVTLGIVFFVGWLFLFRQLRGKEAILLTVATIAATVAIVVGSMLDLDHLTKLIGKDPTLTGRTAIYGAVLDSILKHPFLGYGYCAFWHGLNHESLIVGLRVHWMTIGYAENGFLELCLWLGAAGLALALLYLGRAIIHSIKLIRLGCYNSSVGWFSLIIFLELITNAEAGFVMAPGHIEWALTLVAFVGLAHQMPKPSRVGMQASLLSSY